MVRRNKVKAFRARFASVCFAFNDYGDGPSAWMLATYPDGDTDQPGEHIIAEGETRANCLRRYLGLPARRYPSAPMSDAELDALWEAEQRQRDEADPFE